MNPFPPAMLGRWQRAALALLSLAIWLGVPERARACGGPCSVPRFHALDLQQGQLVVSSNFGLLYETDGDWQLVCEERIGGLLLKSMKSEAGHIANTGNGLFSNRRDDVCEFSPQTVTDADDYLLDYTIAEGAEDTHVALVHDPETSELQVWSKASGDAFSLMHSLGSEAGHRQIVAAGDAPAVYALGYTSNPRHFTIAFTVDGSEWREYVDDAASRSISLAGVDPAHPERVYLWLETASTEPASLLRFDASSNEAADVLQFAGTEALAGFAVDSSYVYVAGSSAGASSLYAASRGSDDFERIQQDLPALDCLLAEGERLYACGADFSRAADFIVAVSDDRGASWKPRMTLSDLGTVTSCGTDCQQTTNWLYSTFAPSSFGDAGTDSEGAPDPGDAASPAPGGAGGCGMVLGSSSRLPPSAGWTLLGALWLFCRRRRNTTRATLALTSRPRTCRPD